jgi:hypothetical protein
MTVREGRRYLIAACLGIVFLLASPAAARAQILPPIYRPLPIEEGERHRALADSLSEAAEEAIRRAEALEDGSRALRQSDGGVAERLMDEARRVKEQVNRLETRVRVDALTIDGLQVQRNDFMGRAIRHEAVVFETRAALEATRLEIPEDADSLLVVDPRLAAQIRSDSLLAATYRQHAEELSEQADRLAAEIASARERIISLQQQEEQLREYADEIASGRSAGDATATRLDMEALDLRRTAQRLTQEARAQTELADELRVQADRRVMPVRSRVDAMRFYGEDGRAVLSSLVLSLGEGGRSGSIHSELVSDYAGPIRFGAGFVVAEARDDEQVDDEAVASAGEGAALERFFAGGGNFVLYSALPLAFNRSPYHSLTIQTLNKLSADVPGAGRTASGQVPTNLDLGIETYGTFNTYAGRIKVFGLLRSGWTFGNDHFYRNIGRGLGSFGYLQFTAGGEIASVVKVLLSGVRAPEDLGREISLTFQVSR